MLERVGVDLWENFGCEWIKTRAMAVSARLRSGVAAQAGKNFITYHAVFSTLTKLQSRVSYDERQN